MNTSLTKSRPGNVSNNYSGRLVVKNTRMADYSMSRLENMGSSEVQSAFAKERSKADLIKKRISSLKQQLKLKVAEQQSKAAYFKSEADKLSAGVMNVTNLNKMKALTAEAKEYAKSTTEFKIKKFDELKELEGKYEKVKANIDALEKKWFTI